MKIPRFEKGPCNYSLHSYSVQAALSDFFLGMLIGILVVIYPKEIDETLFTGFEKYYLYVGIFCLIGSFFGLVLFVGLKNPKKNIIFILAYLCYVFILAILGLVLFSGLGIEFIIDEYIVSGIVFILLALIMPGLLICHGLVIYSLYMNIKEDQEDKNHK